MCLWCVYYVLLILGDLLATVNTEANQATVSSETVFSYIEGLQLETTALHRGVVERQCVVKILEQVMASHKTSCVRFRDSIGAKLTLLRNLLAS